MRVKEFGYTVDVSDAWLRQAGPEALRQVYALLEKEATETELTGPRGGRYQRIGDLYGWDGSEVGIRGSRSYVVLTKARYVKPKR